VAGGFGRGTSTGAAGRSSFNTFVNLHETRVWTDASQWGPVNRLELISNSSPKLVAAGEIGFMSDIEQ
jgi:hypothetical protein